jgi:hypothetical protein
MIVARARLEHNDSHSKRAFNASAERVCLANPERARRFLFIHPGSQEIIQAEIDAGVGGKYLFVARRNGKESDHFGDYLEIDRLSGWYSHLNEALRSSAVIGQLPGQRVCR